MLLAELSFLLKLKNTIDLLLNLSGAEIWTLSACIRFQGHNFDTVCFTFASLPVAAFVRSLALAVRSLLEVFFSLSLDTAVYFDDVAHFTRWGRAACRPGEGAARGGIAPLCYPNVRDVGT